MCIRDRGTAILEYLLSKGGDVNAVKWDFDTPLHDAAAVGLKSHVEILLRSGADPSATNIYGKTPSDVASEPEIKKILENAHEEWRIRRLGLAPIPLVEGPF